MTTAKQSNDAEFNLFNALLLEESGISFDKNRKDILDSILLSRMSINKINSFMEFYSLLKTSPEELTQLIEDIVIGETYFFRNSPQIEVLIKNILPEIYKRKASSSSKELQIWSAGCSRGDEPYSIAIAVLETLEFPKDWKIRIFGTDINKQALKFAEKGEYSKRSVENIPEEYIKKYFTKKNDTYLLSEKIKRMVVFKYQNLTKPDFDDETFSNLDIIFCRNVTIYFKPEISQRLIDFFYDCLSDVGYLFLGHSESLWQKPTRFKVRMFPTTYIYEKSFDDEEESFKPFISFPEISSQFKEHPKKVSDIVFPTKEVVSANNIENQVLFQKAFEHYNKREYAESNQLIDEILKNKYDDEKALFLRAEILSNQEDYENACDILNKIIAKNNLSMDAHYLLGVVEYRLGNLTEAEENFRKVLYIDANIELAYFNLGTIYLYLKEYKKALREFKNALQIMEKLDVAGKIQYGPDFTRDILMETCRNYISEIEHLLKGAL
ncbi:MAG: CheR family methyltransferase [Pseudomonadota bacterium]